MPSSTMTEENEWKLPKETPLLVQLNSVEVKTIKYTRDGKEKSFDKWKWEFEVIEPVDYGGLRAWGETEDRLTTHPDNLVRQWGESLRGAPFALGEGIDTDDLLGVQCVITVDNTSRPKADGSGNWYDCPVVDVFPASAWAELNGEAPF